MRENTTFQLEMQRYLDRMPRRGDAYGETPVKPPKSILPSAKTIISPPDGTNNFVRGVTQ